MAGLPTTQEKEIALGQQSVPRYTSYPTAPNFSAEVDAKLHTSWLASVPEGEALSLYLHVPYCVELCHYCGCNTSATQQREPVEAYTKDLVAEIALVTKRLSGKKVRRIHWGGGTPSILGGDGLKRVFRSISSYFDLSRLREHAIELDPRRIDSQTTRALAEIGVNRANFGVQEFSMPVQRAMGRVQSFEVVNQAVEELRNEGIANIGVDLMYGLPLQTAQDVKSSATLAARLKPQRVAIFGYAHVPWFKKRQSLIDSNTLPDAEARFSQAMTAHQAWTDLGYKAIGIDHFALPDDGLAIAAGRGKLRRNFQGYTDDDSSVLLGFGASAISRFPKGYAQNHPATSVYRKALSSGALATSRGVSLTPDDILRAKIIERLMCVFSVDIDHLVCGQEPAIFSSELARIDQLSAKGIVRRSGRKISVTDSGRPYVRIIASVFDRYLSQGTTRHSQAV